MEANRRILRVLNAAFNLVMALLLVVSGAYSAFALWDNQRIYAAAGDVQADMIKMKPQLTAVAGSEEPQADFSDLLRINPDVCAWLTLDNTEIDYPILQGENNFSYINTDVYGNFALAGSIFLDSRCSRDFTDANSLIYGHHMVEHKMFGDLDLYKEETFFRENRTGMLILPDRAYNLDIFACLVVNASEDTIFEPTRWKAGNIKTFLSFVETENLHLRQEVVEELKGMEAPLQILSLSTCSSEFTDARTIVLAVMQPYSGSLTPEELGGQ